ncbi:MAG: hypothetical protein MI810_25390, partial [Flavobacteriales bacterium]|nr:hypothetical protein [Flavobacteriales bacterium]
IYYSTDLTVTTDAEAPERYIGEEYQGGIIAGMKCDGSHGVIVAPAHYLWASTHLDALEACEDLDYGGKTDWGLANLTQLREVYRNLHLTGIESFHNGYYWSTTYAGSEIVDYYYYIHFVSGTEDYTAAYNELRPCPARTF